MGKFRLIEDIKDVDDENVEKLQKETYQNQRSGKQRNRSIKKHVELSLQLTVNSFVRLERNWHIIISNRRAWIHLKRIFNYSNVRSEGNDILRHRNQPSSDVTKSKK